MELQINDERCTLSAFDEVPDEQADAARRAVANCPERAIELDECAAPSEGMETAPAVTTHHLQERRGP